MGVLVLPNKYPTIFSDAAIPVVEFLTVKNPPEKLSSLRFRLRPDLYRTPPCRTSRWIRCERSWTRRITSAPWVSLHTWITANLPWLTLWILEVECCFEKQRTRRWMVRGDFLFGAEMFCWESEWYLECWDVSEILKFGAPCKHILDGFHVSSNSQCWSVFRCFQCRF